MYLFMASSKNDNVIIHICRVFLKQKKKLSVLISKLVLCVEETKLTKFHFLLTSDACNLNVLIVEFFRSINSY